MNILGLGWKIIDKIFISSMRSFSKPKEYTNIYYSRVHISSDEVFSKILKKPSIRGIYLHYDFEISSLKNRV